MKSHSSLFQRGLCFALFSASVILCDAATIIVNEGFIANNQALPGGASYASNISSSAPNWTTTTGAWGVTGTPDIQLAWSSTATSPGLGFDTFANFTTHGKVIQLDGSGGGSQPTFQILFTPTAGSGVYLNSFDLISGNTAAKTVTWSLTGATSGTLASGSWSANSDIRNMLNVGAGGAIGEALTLTLVETTGASTFIGLDNIAFDQVPEPSTACLALLGTCGWLLKRRR